MKVIAYAIFFAALVSITQCATKCYLCDRCPDPFNTNAKGVDLEDCGADNYECITVSKKGSTFNSVSRGCKKPGTCESGVTTEDGIVVTTSCCQTDLCNSAFSSFKPNFQLNITILISLLITLFSVFVMKN